MGYAKGMPKLADAALLAETFANEIVFERPRARRWPGRSVAGTLLRFVVRRC